MSEIPSPVLFGRAREQQKVHRKSRFGCKVCKARKIKCDEVRPVCGNCYKRFPNAEEECEFDREPFRRGRSPGSAKGSSVDTPSRSLTTTPSLSTSSSSSFAASRSMELRLFHHFSTVTCLVLPGCEEAAGLKMCKVNIPSLAFEYSSIYSAILGMSALHLLTLSPDDVALKAAAYQYIDETVSAHRKETSRLESENLLIRFVTSLLLTMHAKVRSRYEAHDDVPYTLPVNYFVLQNGTTDIWQQSPEWDPEVEAYVTCYSHLAPRMRPIKPPEFDHHVYISQELPYDPLPRLLQSDSSISPDRKEIYAQALSYVALIKDCIISGERPSWIRNRLGIVPSVLGKRFYNLMQNSDPVALLILARLFSLFKFVDEPWWLQGTAEYEIRGLENLLPEEWKWGIQWPLGILENSAQFVVEQG